MRSKVTIVLLFLNVVLFFYIFQFEEKWRAEQKTLEARRRVLGPEAAAIDALSHTSRTGEKLKLEKRADGWWLTAPYEWPADPNAVSSVINALQFLEHETSFAVADLAKSSQTLADYGLEQPALTLSFHSAGQTYQLKIGDDTKIGNRLYVLSPDGKRIHVVNRSLAESVGLPLDTLRSKSIFSIPVFEVRSLNVQTAAPSNLKVRLRRDAAAHWAFEAPINARASKSAVEVTINALNGLTAKNFLEPRDSDLERTGLNTPILRVTLEGNARRETLLLGNATGAPTPPREGAATPDPEYFAKIEDKSVVFTTVVPAPLLKVLRTTQEDLRDPRILDFEPATVSSLTLVAPGQPELTLQRLEPDTPATAGTQPAATGAKEGWQQVIRVTGQAPVTSAADPGMVTDLLQKLSLLSAHEPRPDAPRFLSDAPSATDLENWGFNRPEREVTLNLSTGGGPLGKEASSLTLQVGISPDKPGEAFARVTNAPFVYQILPDILSDAPALARHYRLRLLRELPETARLTSLKLTALPAGTVVFSATNEAALTPESLATVKISDKARLALTALIGQLRTLRAKNFTADSFTPDHAETPTGPQPWKFQLEIGIALPGGSGTAPISTSTLFFTDRLGGTTMLAGTADFGGVVFEVTQEMLDTLFTLTYAEKHDPGLPATEPAPAGSSATGEATVPAATTAPTVPAPAATVPATPAKTVPAPPEGKP